MCLDYLRDCLEPADSNHVSFLKQKYKRRPEPHLKSTHASRFGVTFYAVLSVRGRGKLLQIGGWSLKLGLEDKVGMYKEIIIIGRGKMIKTMIEVFRIVQ